MEPAQEPRIEPTAEKKPKIVKLSEAIILIDCRAIKPADILRVR